MSTPPVHHNDNAGGMPFGENVVGASCALHFVLWVDGRRSFAIPSVHSCGNSTALRSLWITIPIGLLAYRIATEPGDFVLDLRDGRNGSFSEIADRMMFSRALLRMVHGQLAQQNEYKIDGQGCTIAHSREIRLTHIVM